jgi:uncharacterized protein (TIGR00162 family)
MNTTITMKKGTKPNKPVLIVGLPGIGNVGRLVAIHLIRELHAQRFATLHSDHLPHQVVMLKSGKLRLVNNRFYLARGTQGRPDIVILTGDAQAVTPEGQYELNTKITDFFVSELNGRFIYSLGGYNRENAPVKSPKVFANATSAGVISKFKDNGVVFGESRGMIWGSMGLIVALAKRRGVEGICLMGESGMLEVDAAAAKAVMKVLVASLDIKVDTTKFDKMIEKTAATISELERQLAGQPIPGYPMPQAPPPAPSDQHPSYIR